MFELTGVNSQASRLRQYYHDHDQVPDNMQGPYVPGGKTGNTNLVLVSSGPHMFLDFISDGSETSEGFIVAVNLWRAGTNCI